MVDDLPALPVPNLGYACINSVLRAGKPSVYTNRTCVLKTFQERGLEHVSSLALANTRDLATIVQWNHEHGIRLFRMSSDIFPWASEYRLSELPDYDAICANLARVGTLATRYGQRLTYHPSHFVCLASPRDEVVRKGVHELETHSESLDLMGFAPSHRNKINLHVGGVYGDKAAALERWGAAFDRLSDGCRARVTLENDDVPTQYSVDDLLPLARGRGIPVVYDLHHFRFCRGALDGRAALEAAMATWPAGVRPVVHWSESQAGRKPLAHSDFVYGPLDLYGHEADVDVMIEAKAKEQALLRYRDGPATAPVA